MKGSAAEILSAWFSGLDQLAVPGLQQSPQELQAPSQSGKGVEHFCPRPLPPHTDRVHAPAP